ncbi:hypothetical protein J4434_00360 [Candidatus Woesearchaeota archaeon]|nr:hypothetical protein [Candidatus Woesearchaeota archaeon]
MAKTSTSKKKLIQPVSLSDLADVSFDESGNLIFLPKSVNGLDEGETESYNENYGASYILGTGEFDEDSDEIDESDDQDDDKEPDEKVTPEGLVALVKKGAFIFYRCNVCEALNVGKTVYAGGTYDLNLVRSHYHILPFQDKPKLVILDVYLSRECMLEAKGRNVCFTSEYQSLELTRCPRIRL